MKKEKTNIFDGSTKNYLMRNNGFAVGFNMPEALKGEVSHGLPPYTKIMPYLVDKYPACPKDWLRSEGIVKSYFVPVIEDRGMWLDLNENESHTHHVAIVISIQGVNPITGMPCKDAQLEQYIEECPKHKIKFGPDRYCSKCDYKWPKQNYICTTGTERGRLWLDGFRSAEGIVRQYILTAEKMRGVASNVIGKDKVYAIGLSFFVSKEKKPQNTVEIRGGSYGQPQFFSPVHTPVNWQVPTASASGSIPMSWGKDSNTTKWVTRCGVIGKTKGVKSSGYKKMGGSSTTAAYSSSTFDCLASSPGACASEIDHSQKGFLEVDRHCDITDDGVKGILRSKSSNSSKSVKTVQAKKLEVGAGAKISQDVGNDPERLDFWHDKPESIICINYADEASCRKIIEQGEVNIEGHKEGFLKELPVGN